jgi:hypothetical protein
MISTIEVQSEEKVVEDFEMEKELKGRAVLYFLDQFVNDVTRILTNFLF